MIECPECGHQNQERDRLCQACGAELDQAVSAPPATIPETAPLSSASDAYAPLPVGALVDDGRYVVLEVRSVDEERALYIVEDLVAMRPCKNCGELVPADIHFCDVCGADVSSVEPVHMRYRLREYANLEMLAGEVRLMEMQLSHPGLLLPLKLFTEAPYGPLRQYRLAAEFPPQRASTVSVPQEVDRVLGWGLDLARALDYLHQHRIALPSISPKSVAVRGKRALLAELAEVQVLPVEIQTAPLGTFAHDVQSLAQTLFYLATGRQHFTEDIELPEPFIAALQSALDKSAETSAAALIQGLEVTLEALRHPDSVSLVVGQRTDVGRVRALNEDSLLTLSQAQVLRSIDHPVGVFVVADGMGGHEAGDIASRLTVQAVADHAISVLLPQAVRGEAWPDPEAWLVEAVRAANTAVYERRNAARSDMGTTLVMALFVGAKAFVANVGDSRCYHLTESGLMQVTADHSLVARLVAAGQITEEEAEVHPQKNLIYRVMGDTADVELDTFAAKLAPGEALLLCSDGLSGMVSDARIWEIWRAAASPQEACDRLVEAANEAGGQDNVTVVIVQVME